MHEYTVIGHPRQKVIFYLAFISILISPLITQFIHFSLQYFNIVITTSIGSSVIFSILYIIFNKFLWKLSIFKNLLCFPDLNGHWECEGISYKKESNEKFEWQGKVIVKQTWDKLLITVVTNNSTSRSISVIGGIKHYPGSCYKLSYHYENIPNISNAELGKHEGFCVLDYEEDLNSATGYYFNNSKERATYGEMKLKKGVKSCAQ